MVNHFRCLLFNQSGPAPTLAAGEEYVPPGFVAVPLPTALLKVRSILFGTNPDRRMLLYRTRQLLACLHAGPLEEAAFALDPRVTYLPLVRGGFELPGGLTVTPLGHTYPLLVTGPPPVEQGGRTTYFWTVTFGADTTLTITPATGLKTITALNYQPGGQVQAPVPGTSLSFLLSSVPGGTSWTVQYLANPATDLSTVAINLANAGDAALLALFGGNTGIEPYQSWGNLWASRRPLPERLAAAVAALVYRTEAIRVGAS